MLLLLVHLIYLVLRLIWWPDVNVDTHIQVPMWRSLLALHTYFSALVPCHYRCAYVHSLLLLLHFNTIMFILAGMGTQFAFSSRMDLILCCIVAATLPHALRPAAHYLYFYYRFDVEDVERALRLHERTRKRQTGDGVLKFEYNIEGYITQQRWANRYEVDELERTSLSADSDQENMFQEIKRRAARQSVFAELQLPRGYERRAQCNHEPRHLLVRRAAQHTTTLLLGERDTEFELQLKQKIRDDEERVMKNSIPDLKGEDGTDEGDAEGNLFTLNSFVVDQQDDNSFSIDISSLQKRDQRIVVPQTISGSRSVGTAELVLENETTTSLESTQRQAVAPTTGNPHRRSSGMRRLASVVSGFEYPIDVSEAPPQGATTYNKLWTQLPSNKFASNEMKRNLTTVKRKELLHTSAAEFSKLTSRHSKKWFGPEECTSRRVQHRETFDAPITTHHLLTSMTLLVIVLFIVGGTYQFTHLIEEQADRSGDSNCNLFWLALMLTLLIDVVVVQPVSLLLVLLYRNMTAEEDDDHLLFSELHPFFGEWRECGCIDHEKDGEDETQIATLVPPPPSASSGSLSQPDEATDLPELDEPAAASTNLPASLPPGPTRGNSFYYDSLFASAQERGCTMFKAFLLQHKGTERSVGVSTPSEKQGND